MSEPTSALPWTVLPVRRDGSDDYQHVALMRTNSEFLWRFEETARVLLTIRNQHHPLNFTALSLRCPAGNVELFTIAAIREFMPNGFDPYAEALRLVPSEVLQGLLERYGNDWAAHPRVYGEEVLIRDVVAADLFSFWWQACDRDSDAVYQTVGFGFDELKAKLLDARAART